MDFNQWYISSGMERTTISSPNGATAEIITDSRLNLPVKPQKTGFADVSARGGCGNSPFWSPARMVSEASGKCVLRF